MFKHLMRIIIGFTIVAVAISIATIVVALLPVLGPLVVYIPFALLLFYLIGCLVIDE